MAPNEAELCPICDSPVDDACRACPEHLGVIREALKDIRDRYLTEQAAAASKAGHDYELVATLDAWDFLKPRD